MLDSLYSTCERDHFRTRIERTPSGGTEIYISHRGMVEVYTNQEQDQTVWQPRPTDPELEAEFLSRLMVKLGVPAGRAVARTSSRHARRRAAQRRARVSSTGRRPVVQIDEGFDRAWRRVGLALDRTGFTVEDRDRAGALLRPLRRSEPVPARKSRVSGAELFGAKDEPSRRRRATASRSRATASAPRSRCSNAQGAPATADAGQRIVSLLAEDLR